MAYAALVSLSQVLEQILPLDHDYILLCRKKKMKSLYENVIFLKEFLEDFSVKSSTKIYELESRIRDVAYKLEDVMESYISRSSTELILAFGTCIENVDSIMEEAMEMKKQFENKDELGPDSLLASSSRGAPSGKETKVGLEKDLIQIKERVTGQESTLQIIPIVGMGGIGKTTLARNVFEDPLCVDYFDVRSWVTVSQEYHLRDILQVLVSMKGQNEDRVELLIQYLYQSLKGRRFLIVLDDMWHVEVWDKLKRAFPDDNNGSRIVLTTRLLELAAEIDSYTPLHQMQFLNEDQSWELFREKVYGPERCPPHLEAIGKVISRNCRGLPLAIVVIAGLLKVHNTQNYWEKVAGNVCAEASTDHDQFSRILSLSYDNLPPHLKPCFLYMGIFPEDHEISTNKLLKLWVAEGFLSSRRRIRMEEMAEEYLEDLVGRSLVLVTKRKLNGKISKCSIHDMLRELSLRKAKEDKFLQHFTDRYMDRLDFPDKIMNLRRITVRSTKYLDSLADDAIINTSPIRSLLYFCPSSSQLLPFACHFSLLRVLDSIPLVSNIFPHEIFELINLRYLAFTYNINRPCVIPTSIFKLQNLQTIIFHTKLGKQATDMKLTLPFDIWKMPQLRHIILIRYTTLFFSNEDNNSYAVLKNLQTLSKVTNFRFTKKAIETFPNVKKMKIHYESLRLGPNGWNEFCLENLVNLHQLEELEFRILKNLYLTRDPLPTNISFPRNLKKLKLTRSGIPWEKMSVIGSLPIEVLKLKKNSFVGREWEPIEGQFLRLKYLRMQNLDLEDWRAESTHFPCLEKLSISYCYQLKEVPSSIGDIATLQKLNIISCNREAEESVRQIQEEQESFGNDLLKFHIVYSYSPEEIPERPRHDNRPPRVVLLEEWAEDNCFSLLEN